jgi:ABC-type phosphate/phosphonate transport system substrate-binding protein
MQAALPMYFVPQPALQAFWAELAEVLRGDPAVQGSDLPALLHTPGDLHDQWLEPDLLLSQACGYPLVTQLAGKVQVVGTFAYRAPGVRGISCRSQLICRADDPRQTLNDFAGSTLAFNDTISQSGYNSLRALVASTTTQRPFFAAAHQTGAHYASITAVREGRADMAAIDAVTWAHGQRSNPDLAAALRVFGQTEPYPGLPLITSLQTTPAVLTALRRALHTLATAAPYAEVRAPLLISGFEATTWADYQPCLDMQELAYAKGLRTL